MRAQERSVRLPRLRLHYLEWGTPANPSVILLHGGSAHAHWWDFFAEEIADAYHVVALDLRGHGDSDPPDPPSYRIEDYATDLAAVAEALSLTRFHLVGHSLGGIAATAYAGRAPERIDSLVIVDTQVRISPAGAHYMARLRNFPQLQYRDRDEAIRRFRLLPKATSAEAGIVAHVAAHSFRQLADGRWTLKFDRESLAHAEPQDLTGILARLRCPILLIRGEHSPLLSSRALTVLRAAVPHAEAVEIPNAHHHVMLDNPAAFACTVREFLDRHRAGGP